MRKHFDLSSIVVIAFTLVLFLTAVWIKGFTHELLLEAGVFMVSVKLIMIGYKNSVLAVETEEHLKQIQLLLQNIQRKADA